MKYTEVLIGLHYNKMSNIDMYNEFTIGSGVRCRCHLWFDITVRLSELNVKCDEFSKRQILRDVFFLLARRMAGEKRLTLDALGFGL